MWLPVAAWALYAPLGIKYTAYLTAVLLAVLALRGQTPSAPLWKPWAPRLWLACFALLALSAAWSQAPWPHLVTHMWLYALPLGVVPLAAACPRGTALQTLKQYTMASAAVGVLSALHAAGLLPELALWSSTISAIGNQRIATSLLLALGAAIALWLAAQAGSGRQRATWVALAAAAALGLVSQDRRTGMLMLPLLLLAWGLMSGAGLRGKGLMVLVVTAAVVLVASASSMVRARFAEGLNELQTYQSSDNAATSWGQRLRMYERTGEMVRERPWFGHGLGSWQQQWDARITPGTALLRNSTPHNEYLLVAQQAGIPAALLLTTALAASLQAALRAGTAGVPAMMFWLSIALAGLANAVLRDAKFSLALLLLAGVGQALYRPASRAHNG